MRTFWPARSCGLYPSTRSTERLAAWIVPKASMTTVGSSSESSSAVSSRVMRADVPAGSSSASLLMRNEQDTPRPRLSALLHRPGHFRERLLRIAEHHHRVRAHEQLVLDAGEPGVHAALQHDHRARLVGV